MIMLSSLLSVLAVVLLGFMFGHPMGIEPATVAMLGGALLLLLDNLSRTPEEKSENVHHTFGEVEWVTIFFFVDLQFLLEMFFKNADLGFELRFLTFALELRK